MPSSSFMGGEGFHLAQIRLRRIPHVITCLVANAQVSEEKTQTVVSRSRSLFFNKMFIFVLNINYVSMVNLK